MSEPEIDPETDLSSVSGDAQESNPLLVRGPQLVDQLMAEQDGVLQQLNELDAQIERMIIALIEERQRSDKSAA